MRLAGGAGNNYATKVTIRFLAGGTTIAACKLLP